MISEWLRQFIEKDKYVAEKRCEEAMRSQSLIAIIAAVGFSIMSIVNVIKQSYVMLCTTLLGALIMIIGFFIYSKYKKDGSVKTAFIIVLVTLFPYYVIRGGNDGFAALWMCVVTYLTMYFIDFITGFVINIFYLVTLIIVFNFHLPFVNYDVGGYTETFLTRFPLLFLVNFAFATYFIINDRNTQYELILSRENFEKQSVLDLNTGLYNRNAFITYLNHFDGVGFEKMTAVYIDANGLHEINNTKGHAAGDAFLKCIAAYCKEKFPRELIYRLGGDEFLIITKTIDYDTIYSNMLKIDQQLAYENYSVAYGIVSGEEVSTLKDMVDAANRKMLENKAKHYMLKGNDRRKCREAIADRD